MSIARRITRRQALAEMLAGTALIAVGCGTSNQLRPDPDGSTLRTTYRDPEGTGVLVTGRGEPLRPRTELGPQARAVGVIATIAHVTDAHILDAESPGTCDVPRPARAAVPIDVPSPGDTDRTSAGRSSARDPSDRTRCSDPRRRPDRQRPVKRTGPRAGDPEGWTRAAGQRRCRVFRSAIAQRCRPLLLSARPRRPAPPGAARSGDSCLHEPRRR